MKKSKLILTIITLVCVAIGFVLGIAAPEFCGKIEFFGKWYVDNLKVIIGPIIFTSIFLNVLKRNKNSSLTIAKTVGLFVVMFIISFLITSAVVAIAKPGIDYNINSEKNTDLTADFGVLAILKHLLPKDLETFFYGGSIFFVIILAFVLSIIISFTPIRDKAAEVAEVVKKYLSYALKIIVFLTPLAVISLVSKMVAKNGAALLGVGLKYILYAWGCSILIVILVMVLPVWFIAKVNPIQYIKKVSKVWLVSLSSCSSVATLPYTIRCCNEDFGVDEKITNIVVPLGCTIHMCGGAVSFALLGLFVAQLNGVTVTFGTYILMLLASTLINMAAPGIPGGGKVIGMSYLLLLGFPIDGFYGFYEGIYPLLDMSYTTLNVTGDISANIIINHFEKKEEVSESSVEEQPTNE